MKTTDCGICELSKNNTDKDSEKDTVTFTLMSFLVECLILVITILPFVVNTALNPVTTFL